MVLTPGLPSADAVRALPPAVSLSLVLSLDGQLRGHDGSSRSISGVEDLAWLRTLRAAADVVAVGASTAQTERYTTSLTHPDHAAFRRAHGLPPHARLVILRSDAPTPLHDLGAHVLLEAGVRLHTVLAREIDRLWLSHSPTVVGDAGAAIGLPLDGFALASRHVGEEFVVSRFERVSRR